MSGRMLAPRAPGASRAYTRGIVAEPARTNDLSTLHQRFGNRATGFLLQTKLRVGEPNDRYEIEADRVADTVMRTADPVAEELHSVAGASLVQPCSCGGTCASCSSHKKEDEDLLTQRQALSNAPVTLVQRDATESCAVKDEEPEPEEAAEQEEEKKVLEEGQQREEEAAATEGSEEESDDTKPPVQRKGRGAAMATPESVEARIEHTRGNGAMLPGDTRQFMESRLGHDFSGVRVHTDGASHVLNRDLNSLAFTTGRDIYFAPGQFQPGTASGKHLLAHELTHVVQQAGGRGGVVREKADPNVVSRASRLERKSYYYSLHRVSGTSIHHIIERLLRRANSNLVTEAAIPGADRFSPKLNKIGVADLYSSTPANTVTGVKGLREVAEPKDVIAMNNPGAVGTQPANVSSSPTRTGVGPQRGWNGQFPSKVLLGEIKPLAASKVGAGWFQLDNYKNGYQAFVKRVFDLSGKTTGASIDIARMRLTIPPNLNWDNFATQAATPSPESTTSTGRRFWVADLGSGVYVYFDLDSGLRGGQPPRFAAEVTRMREIREDLTREQPRTEPLDAMPVAGKFLPGPRNIAPTPGAARAQTVQRKTSDRPANYWSDRGREWEKKRGTWGRKFRSELRSEFRIYRDKLRVEKKLGRSGRSAPAAEQKESKEYSQVMFWSGLAGRFLGKVRFLMGSAWDKIMGIFEKFKEKMHGLRQKVSGTPEEGVASVGWQKVLLKILIKAAKVVTVKFLTESFNFFVDCFHSAMDKVIAKIQAELTEKFAEELCQARKFFESSKKRLEDEWGISITKLMELVEEIQDAARWIDIAMGLITLIRLGVEAISCLSPPALGCLWGLVAQIGIGAGLDLLIGTRWFDDNIVTPTIRDLVRTYASPYYQKLINRALGEDLKEYHCHIADEQFPKLAYAGDSTGIEGASLIAHRDAWESRHEDEMLKDLQKVFKSKKGQPATKEELKALADAIAKSGKKPEEIKAMLLAARDPASGKLDAQQAAGNVASGEVPEVKEKKRKIDYPKAAKANVAFQKQLGWDPMTFYAKPGVRVDSEEFADAVYDLQEALRIYADGILGDGTLKAFYDRNKLKKDAAYTAAVKAQDERKAAKEKLEKAKAEKEKAERDKAAGESQQGGPDYVIAVGVPKPPPGTPIVSPDYMASEPGWVSIPFGGVEPTITGNETAGMMLTVSVRFWLEHQWVWFMDIPATFVRASSLNGRRIVDVKTDGVFYFKLTTSSTNTYPYSGGAIFID